MVDNERENLANARRKLKKFRDQQQQPPNTVESNGNNVQPLSGSAEPAFHQTMLPPHPAQFIPDALVAPNGISLNPSRSPVPTFVDPSRQNGSPSDHPKPDRTRPDNQRLSSGGSNMSRRSSQTSVDSEQKLRRDNEHLQEQLEVHVQTIGILVAEKTDISAKLTQSFKQLERKQSEMDELYGRLKASRERVQELEKEIQNSTSNVQKREMAAKESDKENDRLKIENIRQSQSIEDLKKNINELNGKLRDREAHLDQVNTELQQLKTQSQSNHDASLAEQLTQKNSQLEELVSSNNRIRSDNEQYQQYNSNMQHHIQDLTGQINQLTETNAALQKQQNEMRLSDQHSAVAHDDLQQENHLLRNAIDQWSNRYEDLRMKLEEMTKLSMEKDESIVASDPPPSRTSREDETQTDTPKPEPPPAPIGDPAETDRYNQLISENTELKDRNQELEHVVQQLQSETETIGDYIRLYQQQREQLQKRYQEKDDSMKALAQERWNFQKKLSELHDLLIHGLNTASSATNNQSAQSSSIGSPALNDEVKAHVLSLIKAWREKQTFAPIHDVTSSVKVAYTDETAHRCSTCSGSVQCV